MSRSHPYRSKLRSNADCLTVVTHIVESTAAARELACATLRRDVRDYVECFATLPISWLDDSDPARRAIAQDVLERLEADGHGLLKEWRRRVLQRKDEASFWGMVRAVLWYVSHEYARNAERPHPVISPAPRRRSR